MSLTFCGGKAVQGCSCTVSTGVGSSSKMVQAVKNLPQQQQLLICAATKLLGGGGQDQSAASAANQAAKSGLSALPRKVWLKGKAGLSILPQKALLEGKPCAWLIGKADLSLRLVAGRSHHQRFVVAQ